MMSSLLKNKNAQVFLYALGIRLLAFLIIGLVSPHPLPEMAQWYDGKTYLALSESFPPPYEYPSHLYTVKRYPLFPVLIHFASFLFNDTLLGAYAIVVLASTLSTVVFYNIAKEFTANAFGIALLFSVFPPKWFMTSTFVWSEPVFVLCLLSAFLFFLKNKPVLASISMGLAGVTRPIGILFLGSFLLYDYFYQRDRLGATIRYSVLAVIPFVFHHIYLYTRFGKVVLLAHTDEGMLYGKIIFSYPLDGLFSGLSDPHIMVVRKLFTLAIFLFYVLALVASIKNLRHRPNALLSLWFIPFFVFTWFLQGDVVNWWMISFPRLILPVAPAGIILVGSFLSKRTLRYANIAALILGFAYLSSVCLFRTSGTLPT